MFGIKTQTTPVGIGVLGFIKKGLEKHPEKSLRQSAALLGTASIFRKVLFLFCSCARGPWFGPGPSEEKQEL